jgi:hypothetical protein
MFQADLTCRETKAENKFNHTATGTGVLVSNDDVVRVVCVLALPCRHEQRQDLGPAQWHSDWLRAERTVFDSWRGLRIFFFDTTSEPALGPTSNLLSNGYRGLFPWGKAVET